MANIRLHRNPSNSSKKIRRILLTGCRSISDKGLSRVASELPLLEELDISFCEGISHKSLQAVGRSCPLLKSFKLDKCGLAKQLAARTLDEIRRFFFEYADEDALAIAGGMHGLQHLQLVGNPLSVMGLQKILYGCPHLKSLKLRWCSNINVATQVLEEDALHKLRSLEYSQFTDDKGFVLKKFDGLCLTLK
nr:putative F-box/LRR-repeat protein 23 [Malus domestica]